MRLSNKQIAASLYLIAAQPLHGPEYDRFSVTLDGLTIRCANTRAAIEAVAGKYHKNKRLTTKQNFPPTVSTRRESGAAMLKRLKDDVDFKEFHNLLDNKSIKQLSISV